MGGERSNWRDQWISRRHRLLGKDCCGADMDAPVGEYNHVSDGFLFIEGDRFGNPVALVDYKALSFFDTSTLSYSLRLQCNFFKEDGGQLPFFVVCYRSDFAYYTVYPINESAKAEFAFYIEVDHDDHEANADFKELTENNYVEFLHFIRGRISVPSEVFKNLDWIRSLGDRWKDDDFPTTTDGITTIRIRETEMVECSACDGEGFTREECPVRWPWGHWRIPMCSEDCACEVIPFSLLPLCNNGTWPGKPDADTVNVHCRSCDGSSKLDPVECEECNGRGRVRIQKEVAV